MIRCRLWSVFSCPFFSPFCTVPLKKHDSRLPATTCHKTETRNRWRTGSGSQEVILDMKWTWTDTRYTQIQEATRAWPKVWLYKGLEMKKRQQERVAIHYRSAASYKKKCFVFIFFWDDDLLFQEKSWDMAATETVWTKRYWDSRGTTVSIAHSCFD